jgi:peroxiredoxin Q/BCP
VYRNATDPATGTGDSGGSGYAYQVGQPGPGTQAPTFTLAASTGRQLDLASLRGKTVLLYFQEGLSCQPCWDQITDLEQKAADLKAAGVDQVVSVTTDPIDLITRKTRDMGLATPVLSDPDLAVSKTYHANEFGMMGTSRDGHTFILIDAAGAITWRADYGGAPKYTMFVPTDAFLTDLRAGTHGGQP